MATVEARPGRERPYSPPPRKRRRTGWIINLSLALVLLLLLFGIAGGIALAAITRNLPSIAVLDDPNSLGFKTAQIFDRKGQLLWEISDPSGGKRTVVHLQEISPAMTSAILAAEDVHFYENPGVDPVATVRSAWIDFSGQGTTGASTITQQLVRNAILDPAEARQATVKRKLREIVLAYQVDARYSKDQILEMYLNRVYFVEGPEVTRGGLTMPSPMMLDDDAGSMVKHAKQLNAEVLFLETVVEHFGDRAGKTRRHSCRRAPRSGSNRRSSSNGRWKASSRCRSC